MVVSGMGLSGGVGRAEEVVGGFEVLVDGWGVRGVVVPAGEEFVESVEGAVEGASVLVGEGLVWELVEGGGGAVLVVVSAFQFLVP